MRTPLSNKIILYSSLLVTAVINLPRLLLLQHAEIYPAIPFNWYEWWFRLFFVLLYAIWVLFFNRRHFDHKRGKWAFEYDVRCLLINLVVFGAFVLVGGLVSRCFIESKFFVLNGYLLRLGLVSIILMIELKLLGALFMTTQKEQENQALRFANTKIELALLKAQLNPHFLFNALSSLASIVREDPTKAQDYISHLSKIFRYAMSQRQDALVRLEDELADAASYSALMHMRHESGFVLELAVEEKYYGQYLPHMSLQPLIENALKHNMVATDQALKVRIDMVNDCLRVSNNLQMKPHPEPGAGIGLSNLNERFKILIGKEIDICSTASTFTVTLPLLER